MARRNRRKYTPEQKADAVQLVREVGSLAQVARDLDLTESSLRNWVKQAKIDEGQGPEGALNTEERAELRRLRRENRTLAMEREFLKKAAVGSIHQRNTMSDACSLTGGLDGTTWTPRTLGLEKGRGLATVAGG